MASPAGFYARTFCKSQYNKAAKMPRPKGINDSLRRALALELPAVVIAVAGPEPRAGVITGCYTLV